MASATSSSESNPSGLCAMNAPIRAAPSGSMRGATSTSTERGGVDVVLAHGHEARAAAHRGADEDRRDGVDVLDQCDEVGHHEVLPVLAVGSPIGVTVAARVEGDGVVAGRGQGLPGALPRVPGLTTAVLEQHHGSVRVAPLVAGQAHAAGTGPVAHRFGGGRQPSPGTHPGNTAGTVGAGPTCGCDEWRIAGASTLS